MKQENYLRKDLIRSAILTAGGIVIIVAAYFSKITV